MDIVEKKRPSFSVSLIIVAFLVVSMAAQLISAGSVSIRMTLISATAFAALVLMLTGTKFKTIEEGVMHGCAIAAIPNVIMILIGMLIPTWIASGCIPAVIYYGLRVISPSIFLFTAALVCSIASMVTGSSYTTGATFGVAFIGISLGLGIPLPLTAGAVISGAVIGDKLSPLSDSTNLAAGVCETPLFSHIRSMVYTTAPAFVISSLLYLAAGMRYSSDTIDKTTLNSILEGMWDSFNISPVYAAISLIPMAIVIIFGIKQINAMITMVVAGAAGMLTAILLQGYTLSEMIAFMDGGFSIDTGVAAVDRLLNRGGIESMLWTVSVAILGMVYGGVLEKSGVLEVLLEKLAALTSSARALIPVHVLAALAMNLLSGSQYVALLIPGRMFLPAYRKLGIDSSVASRTCEDAATVTSPLVPWGLCGVYFTGVLGVPTMAYLPYAFLSWLVPIIAVIYAVFGIFIFKEKREEKEETQ